MDEEDPRLLPPVESWTRGTNNVEKEKCVAWSHTKSLFCRMTSESVAVKGLQKNSHEDQGAVLVSSIKSLKT